MAFISSSANSGSYNPGTGQWTVGSIPAGATASLQIDAIVNTADTTTNVAEVFAADQFDSDSIPGDGNPSQDDYDSATFTPARADLSVTKSVNNSAPNVGQGVTFTIIVANAGPDPATGVSVLDQLPPGLTFDSSTTDVGTYSPSTGIWEIGNLAVNDTATLTLAATVTTAESVANTAELRTFGSD